MISGADIYRVLSAILPLYVSIGLGYSSIKLFKILTVEQSAGINRYVALIAVPVLGFQIIAQTNVYEINWPFIAADSICKLVVLLALLLWSQGCPPRSKSRHWVEGWVVTIFMISVLPNTLIIGVPLLSSMYGLYAGTLMAQIVVIQVAVWFPLVLFLLGLQSAKKESLRQMSLRISSRQVADEAGPMADEAGPIADEAGPLADLAGPLADEAGPMADEAGPLDEGVGSPRQGLAGDSAVLNAESAPGAPDDKLESRGGGACEVDLHRVQGPCIGVQGGRTRHSLSRGGSQGDGGPQLGQSGGALDTGPSAALPPQSEDPSQNMRSHALNCRAQEGKASDVIPPGQTSMPPALDDLVTIVIKTEWTQQAQTCDDSSQVCDVSSHICDEIRRSFKDSNGVPETPQTLGHVPSKGLLEPNGNCIHSADHDEPTSAMEDLQELECEDGSKADPGQVVTCDQSRASGREWSGAPAQFILTRCRCLWYQDGSKACGEDCQGDSSEGEGAQALDSGLQCAASEGLPRATAEPETTPAHEGTAPAKSRSLSRSLSRSRLSSLGRSMSMGPGWWDGAAFTNTNHLMPTMSKQDKRAMLWLTLRIVGYKLVTNPNNYAAVLGVGYSLLSFGLGFGMPDIIKNSVEIVGKTGLGMAMFSLGLFMASQKSLIPCGVGTASWTLSLRFVVVPLLMAAAAVAVGIRGTLFQIAVVQAALPPGVATFVFANEYKVNASVLSTGVSFGTLISFPVLLLLYFLLGLSG